MPGIIAIVDPTEKTDLKKIVSRMSESIKHNDSHMVHYYVDEQAGIALGRVCTGILNPEPQPIFNEDRSLAIVMEGEVFDYHDEKRRLIAKGYHFTVNNDPEYVLALYKDCGENFVEKLEGFFTLVIWDILKNKLVVANDRMGFRPLYYATISSRLFVCSEAKGILVAPNFQRKVNLQAASEIFSFGHPLGDKTLFNGIKTLPGASKCSFVQGNWSRQQYWRFDSKKYWNYWSGSEQEYLEELSVRFRNGVERQLAKVHKTALSLTGGLDSRAIRAVIEPSWPVVATFVHGLSNSNDFVLSDQVASRAGVIPHYRYELGEKFLRRLPGLLNEVIYLSDGLTNIGRTALLYSRSQVKDYAQVELSGSGADYSRGWGINTQAIRRASNRAELIQACYDKYVRNYTTPNPFQHPFLQSIDTEAFNALEKSLAIPHPNTPLLMRVNHFYVIEHITKLIRSCWQLVKNHIEYRLAYWDYDYINFLFSAPPELTTDERRIPKHFIRKYNPTLTEVPIQNSQYLVESFAEGLLGHTKMRIQDIIESYYRLYIAPYFPAVASYVTFSRPYTDLNEWMRTDLGIWARQILLDRKTIERGYYSKEGVTALLNKHATKKVNFGDQIGALITFELWHRIFLD